MWVWGLSEPERIRSDALRQLADPANDCYLSPFSVWECLVLAEKQRITATHSQALQMLASTAGTSPFREAPLTFEVARVSRALRLTHNDPADRFIAATAVVYDLMLVTRDQRLLNGAGYATLPA